MFSAENPGMAQKMGVIVLSKGLLNSNKSMRSIRNIEKRNRTYEKELPRA